ncbi:MAG: ACT domain-containing protein [Chloroflexi bacterium]|nr:ACT domain-containing protein [Chloroflexota bacterium]
MGEQVNWINAPLQAVERGIQVTQAKGVASTDHGTLIAVQATLTDGEQITISGTLLDRREPHILQINEYRMDFVPQGHHLIMGSYDRPGVIGRVGTLLADNHINIASWHPGRAQPGGQTLTILTLDEPMPEAVLTELCQLDFVRHAHQVKL